MQTPEDEAPAPSAAPPPLSTTQAAPASEPLACSSCRSRKLKCDRLKPACTRCAKVKNECVYPESRRKPAFKRRNVRELETRLAKLEGLLKDVSPADGLADNLTNGIPNVAPQSGYSSTTVPEPGTMFCGGEFDLNEDFVTNLMNGDMPPVNPTPNPFPVMPDGTPATYDPFGPNELVGLGQFEALPPFEMIEDLHETFFARQAHYIPLIHKGRYLQAFHSAPHMRPPMCLQYAIWTMASNGHEKYSEYHDIFYQRTRRYLEADEVKGYGEHFLTIPHLQAWALTATAEARRLFFTRAGMSCAKCVKLIHMMGLHRLDDDSDEARLMTPTLAPPQSWVELEERRRCFWGVFCIDSHASISTGWPNLIDVTEVTTRLPSTEEAFNQCKEVKSPTLDESIKGAEYSTFASAAIVCFIFNQILKHIHRPKPTDRPDDINYGPFWQRHRELDNILSSFFMFLPERFRLPKNIRDPVALHTNLNLHASIICLHNAASDKADKLKLPAHVKKTSHERSLTAAAEIVNIMKMSSHLASNYKSPLVSLSLYCAVSTYIHQSKNNNGVCDVQNLEFLVNCMVVISKEHIITRAYLQQAMLDIERNGVVTSLDVPIAEILNKGSCAHNIPLLARSSISSHSEMQSALPGRLPLGKAGQVRYSFEKSQSIISSMKGDWLCPYPTTAEDEVVVDLNAAEADRPAGKRKRKSAEPRPQTSSAKTNRRAGPAVTTTATTSSSSSSSSASSISSATAASSSAAAAAPSSRQPVFGAAFAAGRAELPHRTGSPTSAALSATAAPAVPRSNPALDLSAQSGASASGMAAPAAAQPVPDMNMLRMFQSIDEQWDLTNLGTMYEHIAEMAQKGPGFDDGSGGTDHWNWDAGG